MYTVYEIENTLTDMKYIGVTKGCHERRLYLHTYNNKTFKDIVRESGRECLKVRPLYAVSDKVEAYKLEKAVSKNRNTYYPNGYNKHGSKEFNRTQSLNSARRTKVECIETGEVFNTVNEASEKMEIPRASISSVLCGSTKTAYGHTFRRLK